MVLMSCIVFARVALPTLGAGSVFTLGGGTVSTLGGVVGVVLVFAEFTLAPAIPVVRSFPIFVCTGLSLYLECLVGTTVLQGMDSGRCRGFH